jgi:ribosome maturation factor RimP
MRHVSHELQTLLEPTVEALNYELVGVLYIKSNDIGVLRVYIDRSEGITVEDCAAVSHQISGILDVEEPIKGKYSLEVSSPGLDRLLLKLEHFEKYIGSDVKVWLKVKIDGRGRLTGKILKIKEQEIYIEDTEKEYCLTLGMIDKAKLVPVF